RRTRRCAAGGVCPSRRLARCGVPPAADRGSAPVARRSAGRQHPRGNPGIAACGHRCAGANRAGEGAMAPDPDLGTAADLLRMVPGGPVAEPIVEGLDTYLTSVIENGLNTSAYTARIIASSRASLVSAALGAYCAFTGPLHGGAPGPTLDMLDE